MSRKLDEREKARRREVGSQAFLIMSWGLLLLFLYRTYFLGQDFGAFGDFFLLFVAANAYVVVANFTSGAMGRADLRTIMIVQIPVIVTVILALAFFRGQVKAPADALVIIGASLVPAVLLSMGLNSLYRRWLKKSGLDGE